MAYRIHYSDYSTTAEGPPAPDRWVGPPGPMGPPGPPGPPGPMPPGGPFLPLSGGTVTGPTTFSDMVSMTGSYTWASGAYPGTNPAIYQSLTYTGTTSSGFPGPEGNSVPFNLISISESLTGPTGAGGISALEIQHNTTGGSGARNALLVTHQIHGTMAPGTSTSYVASQIFQQLSANVTGAAAGAGNGKGDGIGLGIMMQASSGVYAHGVTGIEIDINPHSGSSVDYLVGMQILNFGVLGGSSATTANVFDCMLLLASADPTYKQATFGYYFGSPQSGDGKGFPITPTGTMIGSVAGSAGIGIDLSAVTFATAFLKGPGGFQVDNNSTVHTNRILAGSPVVISPSLSAPLTIVDAGDTGSIDLLMINQPSALTGQYSIIRFGRDSLSSMQSGYLAYLSNATPSQSYVCLGVRGSGSDSLIIRGDNTASFAGPVGFNGNTMTTKPTVSGAKGSNAALASLMTALAAYGLVNDTTTA